jgi:hypothetical protein
MHHEVARWVASAVREAAQELTTKMHAAHGTADSAPLQELVAKLAQHESSFAAHLTAGIRAKLADDVDLTGDTAIMPMLPAGLEMLSTDDVDEAIDQAHVVHEMEWQAEPSLSALVARASCLAGLQEAHPKANPLPPSVVIRALTRSVRSWGLSRAARRHGLISVGQALAQQLPAVYAEHAQWLEQAGVGEAGDPLQAHHDWDRPHSVRRPSPQQVLRQWVAWGHQRPSSPPADGPLRILDEPVALSARDDIMDRLFSHLLAQEASRPAVHAMISRLQASARRVAAQDPGVWRSLDHPLWRLIERILCTATVTELDETAVTALHAAIEHTLRALDTSRSLDKQRLVDEVDRLECGVSGVMSAHGERWVSGGDALQARAQKAEWIERLREQLQQQFEQANGSPGLKARGVPAALQRFLREDWAEVLYAASGQGNDSLSRFAAVVDDLINCATRAPGVVLPEPSLRGLMLRVREGLQAADLPRVQQDTALRALTTLLTCPDAVAVTAPLSAARSAAARPASPPRTDLGLLHAALPTVPIGIVADSPHSERADADCRRWLAGLRAGDRLRIHLDAAWTSAVVRWRSADAAVFVVVTQQPPCQQSFTRRALEHMRKAGLVATLEHGELLAKVFLSAMAAGGAGPPAPTGQSNGASRSTLGSGEAAVKSLTSGITVAR